MRKNPIIKLAQFTAVATTVASSNGMSAQNQVLQAGIYENTLVGSNVTEKLVTGFFAEKSNDGTRPSIHCEFYFSGKLTGSTSKIKVYQLTLHDAPTTGTLTIEKSGKESAININLDEEQPGCMNIYPKAELAKTSLNLVSQANWIEIRMVSQRKTYFFKSPSVGAITKTYVTTGDVVGVLEYKDSWANVSYVGGNKTTTGWIKSADLIPSVAR